MAVEPKAYRILSRLKAALVANGSGRYSSSLIKLGFPEINPKSPPKSGEYYIWAEDIKQSSRFEVTDQEEKFQVFSLDVFIYTVVSTKKSREDSLLEYQKTIGYLHDDFVDLNMRDLATSSSDETWIVGKQFISASSTGAYGMNTWDVLVKLMIEFENRGSLYTTS